MSKFYGTVIGSARTPATRRGHSNILTSAQSFDGSVITHLSYRNDELTVRIEIADESSVYGETYFIGTLEELKETLRRSK